MLKAKHSDLCKCYWYPYCTGLCVVEWDPVGGSTFQVVPYSAGEVTETRKSSRCLTWSPGLSWWRGQDYGNHESLLQARRPAPYTPFCLSRVEIFMEKECIRWALGDLCKSKSRSCWRYEIGCFQYIYTRYIKNRIIRTDLGTSLIYQAQICLDPLLTNELMFIQMQTHPMPVITVPPKKIRTCLLTPHVSWEGKPYFHLQVNLRYFIRSEFLISWC